MVVHKAMENRPTFIIRLRTFLRRLLIAGGVGGLAWLSTIPYERERTFTLTDFSKSYRIQQILPDERDTPYQVTITGEFDGSVLINSGCFWSTYVPFDSTSRQTNPCFRRSTRYEGQVSIVPEGWEYATGGFKKAIHIYPETARRGRIEVRVKTSQVVWAWWRWIL